MRDLLERDRGQVNYEYVTEGPSSRTRLRRVSALLRMTQGVDPPDQTNPFALHLRCVLKQSSATNCR